MQWIGSSPSRDLANALTWMLIHPRSQRRAKVRAMASLAFVVCHPSPESMIGSGPGFLHLQLMLVGVIRH